MVINSEGANVNTHESIEIYKDFNKHIVTSFTKWISSYRNVSCDQLPMYPNKYRANTINFPKNIAQLIVIIII